MSKVILIAALLLAGCAAQADERSTVQQEVDDLKLCLEWAQQIQAWNGKSGTQHLQFECLKRIGSPAVDRL
jgi:outer membrane biogenesis lipoprotein LolB